MDTEIFLDALAFTVTVLSLGMFVLGIRVASGKPLLLRSRIYLAVVVLIFVLPMAASFVGAWPPDWADVLFALLGLVVVIPIVVFSMRWGMGDMVVYNATETMIREVLEEALTEHNLPHSEGKGPGLLSRIAAGLYAQSRFSLALKDLNSSIHVTINPLGSVALRFTKKRAIPNYEGLIASLDTRLQTREYNGSRFSGCLMLFTSVAMMGLCIWLLVTR
jgi:hypothetical protein